MGFPNKQTHFNINKWKPFHDYKCPPIKEYGRFFKLKKYCLTCIKFVLYDSSRDWWAYKSIDNMLKQSPQQYKVDSLQNMCLNIIQKTKLNSDSLPPSLSEKIKMYNNLY